MKKTVSLLVLVSVLGSLLCGCAGVRTGSLPTATSAGPSLIITPTVPPASALKSPAAIVAPTATPTKSASVSRVSACAPAATGPAAGAAPGSKISLVAQIGGVGSAVAVSGKYAYLAIGGRIAVLDVSNPATPAFVGQTGPSLTGITAVTVSGRYVYATTGSDELLIVDVARPEAPRTVGSLALRQPSGWYTAHGGARLAVREPYMYVAMRASPRGGLRIINVSNPQAPVEVGSFEVSRESMESLLLVGSNVYAVGSQGLLWTVDVSDPGSPKQAGPPLKLGDFSANTVWGSASARWGNSLFVAGPSGVAVVDVANPRLVGKYDGSITAMAPLQGYLYALDSQGALAVIDVKDPARPLRAGRVGLDNQWASGAIALTESLAFVVGNGGMLVYDISSPLTPRQVGACSSFDAEGVSLAGGQTIVGGKSGLAVIRSEDVPTPLVTGFFPGRQFICSKVGCLNSSVGRYLYWDAVDGTTVVDVGSAGEPRMVGRLPDGALRPIAAIGSVGYTVQDGEIAILDVSNPLNPRQSAGQRLDPRYGQVTNLIARGRYLYLMTEAAGLVTLDATDPRKPSEIAAYRPTYASFLVDAADTYAYLFGPVGPYVLDLRNRKAPQELRSILPDEVVAPAPGVSMPMPVNVRWAAVGGPFDFLITVDYTNGGTVLRALDTSNPAAPKEVAKYLLGATVSTGQQMFATLAVTGSTVYVPGGALGLLVFRVTEG